MKILYIHQYFRFPDQNGGTRSYDLASCFVKEGIDVEIITSTNEIKYKGKRRWEIFEKNGLKVNMIYLPIDNGLTYLRRIIIFIQFLWFSSFKLLSMKGDCVLATSTPLTIGIPALVKNWINGTPFIFEVRDVWPEAVIAIGAIKNNIFKKLLYWLECVIYKNAAAIIPLSTDMKCSIVTRYPQLGRKPVEVIENISEINRFQEGYSLGKSILEEKIGFKPRFTILYAGTFGRVNGIEYVVKLAETLLTIDPTIVFVLIGDGAEKNNVIQAAKDKNIYRKNVFVLNSVSKEELPQFYFECSMGSSFVIDIKELWANSANKFFDTLASGRPVLINHNGWQKDIILKRNMGYVLPEKINDERVNDFALYTQNGMLIKEQRINALQVAKENFALDIAVAKYIAIFDRLNLFKAKKTS